MKKCHGLVKPSFASEASGFTHVDLGKGIHFNCSCLGEFGKARAPPSKRGSAASEVEDFNRLADAVSKRRFDFRTGLQGTEHVDRGDRRSG